MVTDNIIEEFSVPDPNSGCWIWVGHSRKGTYGDHLIDGKYKMAHRLSYEIYNGEIPEGKIICHKCGVPSCVNPKHLYAGTHKENAADRKKHGTHLEGDRHPMYGKKGELSPVYGRKLTEEQCRNMSEKMMGNTNSKSEPKYKSELVKKIREQFEKGYSQTALSKMFGVPISSIHNIVKRKRAYAA